MTQVRFIPQELLNKDLIIRLNPIYNRWGFLLCNIFIIMRYKITDKQLDDVIFIYLDNQDFIQIERQNDIYFTNSEGDRHAQIRYHKKNGWCYVYWKFIGEISSFFSLGRDESEKVIGRWVEYALQVRVTNTDFVMRGAQTTLGIPNK